MPFLDIDAGPTEALRTELWVHQRQAVDFAADRDSALLAMDLGTGKSLAAIALATAWGCRRILITCPLSVVGVWPRELLAHSNIGWNIARCDRGSVAQKTEAARHVVDLANTTDQPYVVVVNHESVWRGTFGQFAMHNGWDLLIVDESHRAKAPTGKLSTFLFNLARMVPRRLALTGTALAHSPLDIFGQARFLDLGHCFGRSFNLFKRRYAKTEPRDIRVRDRESGMLKKRRIFEIVGWKNMDEFAQRLDSFSYRVTKAEATPWLPPELDEDRYTRLEPAASKTYRELERNFWALVKDGEVTVNNGLTKLLRLQQLTSGTLVLDDDTKQIVSEAKKKLLVETLEDVDPHHNYPVVVFARFHQDLDRIRDVVEGDFALCYGEVSGRQKDLTPTATIPNGIDVLGVQIQAGGVGIDLTAASTAIYYSTGFSLAEYLQSRARVHRPGQRKPVTYIHLLCEGTIDQKVRDALQAREEVIKSIIERRKVEHGRAATGNTAH